MRQARMFRNSWTTFYPSLRWPSINTMRVARYALQLELNNCPSQQIRVSWTRCNYGGARPWIHCPHCHRRIARLFKGLSGYFCRACLGNPIYESQRRNRKARAYLRAYRLRQQLGGSRPVVDAVPLRPFRMKRRRYGKLIAKLSGWRVTLLGAVYCDTHRIGYCLSFIDLDTNAMSAFSVAFGGKADTPFRAAHVCF